MSSNVFFAFSEIQHRGADNILASGNLAHAHSPILHLKRRANHFYMNIFKNKQIDKGIDKAILYHAMLTFSIHCFKHLDQV